jgi:hypothetical protein
VPSTHKSTSTPSHTITDNATPSQTSTNSLHASEARSTQANFLHHWSRLLVPRVRVSPPPDARTDTGSPLNEASNESDPRKHQDTTTAVPGSDADADAAEDVTCLLPMGNGAEAGFADIGTERVSDETDYETLLEAVLKQTPEESSDKQEIPRRAGLVIEPDKTELLFFQKLYEHNPMPSPSQLLLPDRDACTYYMVRPVETLRYLGFFIHCRLKWEPHVCIMCN